MRESRLSSLFFSLIAALCGLLFLVCAFIQVDNFDSFNLMLNAKAIANGGGAYSIYRSIVGSLFFAPAFLIEKWAQEPFLGFRFAHLMNAALFVILLYTLYKLFRLHLSKLSSLIATFGFAFLPIVIHYVPIAKEDLPGSLFVTLAFYFYFKVEEKRNVFHLFFTALFTGLAIGCRYNLIPVLFLSFGLNELFSWKQYSKYGNRRLSQSLFYLLILPLLFWLGLPALVYPLLHLSPPAQAPIVFVKELFTQYHQNLFVYKAPFYTYRFLWKALSLPIFIFALIGLLASLAHHHRGSRIHFIWFTTFFLFHSYFVPGKEVRYLFPCLPPLFYFFALGMDSFQSLKWNRILYQFALLLIALIYPFHLGVKECTKFLDPFYWTPFEKQVSLQAKQLANGKSILWFGNFYGTHPKDYIFDLADDFTYLYHFYIHTIHFFTGQPILSVEGGKPVIPQDWQTQGIWLPNIGNQMNDGDVLLVNLERTVSRTSFVPKPVPPLVMQRARKLNITKTSSLSTIPISGKTFELYTRSKGESEFKSLGFYQITSKEEVRALLNLPFSEGYLLSYDSVKLFHSPGNS